MVSESKLYTSKVDYEKLFTELSENVKNSLILLVDYLYNYFTTTLKDKNTSIIYIDCVKTIDCIPVKLCYFMNKNWTNEIKILSELKKILV